MPPQLLCHLCHLPEGGEVLLENATPTAVPPVPPARGGRGAAGKCHTTFEYCTWILYHADIRYQDIRTYKISEYTEP